MYGKPPEGTITCRNQRYLQLLPSLQLLYVDAKKKSDSIRNRIAI